MSEAVGIRSVPGTLVNDVVAGVVVFLVALPLCLGIALASGAPLFSGLIAGIVGGIVVGLISGSRTSVSGPAAGLTAVVAAQITTLGSFDQFLFAVVIAGVIQLALGIARVGALSAFVPASVIHGLLAAIGVILILKQIPHLLGHDTDPEGEMSFSQPDQENTFTELLTLIRGDIHPGAAVVTGLISIALLVCWTRVNFLKRLIIPAQLVVVLLAVAISQVLAKFGAPWEIQASHLVQVPQAKTLDGFLAFLRLPDFSIWNSGYVYLAGVTIAIVASLETLLNVEAVDKIDPLRRGTPPNRELVAQGIGNIVSGMLGGLPMTSVIIRSSVNLDAGGRTKLSTILHGVLLLVSVALLPRYLNMIPLSALAAILLITGIKLASPELFRRMWSGGRYQFIPFITTLLAIVFTDLLVGILIGLAISVGFILNSNLRSPVRMQREKHPGGDVIRVELANQVSFLNRAGSGRQLETAAPGTHLLLDASNSDYIDPDILALIRDFRDRTAVAHGVQVSFQGFRGKYGLKDDVRYRDYATRELQQLLTPDDVLELLREGNRRFCAGERLTRNWERQLKQSSRGQHPYAVVLSCIDSRAPVETIFDLGLGDIFSVRIAGNVTSDKVLGSLEYACSVAGTRLILVLGHTKCGAVTSTVDLCTSTENSELLTGCVHLATVVEEIGASLDPNVPAKVLQDDEARAAYIEDVSRRNVLHSVEQILQLSGVLKRLVESGQVAVVGGMYNVATGCVEFYVQQAHGLPLAACDERSGETE